LRGARLWGRAGSPTPGPVSFLSGTLPPLSCPAAQASNSLNPAIAMTSVMSGVVIGGRRFCTKSLLIGSRGSCKLSTAGHFRLTQVKEAGADSVILFKMQVGTAAKMANPQSLISRLIHLGRSISRQSSKSASGGAHIRGQRLTALPSTEDLVPSSCICFQP